MPKNRTALAAGILALALVVGGFALYNNQKAAKAPETVGAGLTDEPATVVNGTPNENEGTDNTATTDHKGTSTDATTTTTDTKTGTTTSSTTVPETHTVQKNETLRDIAKRYYGDPIYSADIERVNELEDPNMIPVGKVLKLPRRDELNSTSTPTAAPGTNETDKANGTSKEIPTN